MLTSLSCEKNDSHEDDMLDFCDLLGLSEEPAEYDDFPYSYQFSGRKTRSKSDSLAHWRMTNGKRKNVYVLPFEKNVDFIKASNSVSSKITENDEFDVAKRDISNNLLIDSRGFAIVSKASVGFKTRFLDRYWRNDRKNIQCFPMCPEYGDYFFIKSNNLKHTRSGGTCSSNVECYLECLQKPSDLIVLGRIVLIQESFDIKLFYTDEDLNFLKVDTIEGSVQERETKTQIIFSPTVWKFSGTLMKRKKKEHQVVNSILSYCFQVLVLERVPNGVKSVCHSRSEPFSLNSTRTLHRLTTSNRISRKNSVFEDSRNAVELANGTRNAAINFCGSNKRQKVVDYAVPKRNFHANQFKPPVEGMSKTHIKEVQLAVPSKHKIGSRTTKSKEVSVPTAILVQDDFAKSAIFDQNILSLYEVAFWLLALGIFGAHRYYLSKPLTGFFFTLTLGFCGLGVIFDILTLPFLVNRAKIEVVCSKLDIAPLLDVSLNEMYIVALTFGFLGIHRFYLGNYILGLMYMLTLGFLGVGVLADIWNMPYLVEKHNNNQHRKYRELYGEEKFLKALTCKKRLKMISYSSILGVSKY